ncbi:MAG: hypothetical protein ACM3U1_01505 [Chloroflexota bacterium]
MEYYPDQPADNNDDQLKGFRLYSSLEDKEKSSDMPPADLPPADAPTDADPKAEAKYFNSGNSDPESAFIDEIFPSSSEADKVIPGISETREDTPDKAAPLAPETSEEFLDPLYSDTGFEPDLPPAIDAISYEETLTNDNSIDEEPTSVNSPDSNSNAFTAAETGPAETIQTEDLQIKNVQMEDAQLEEIPNEEIPNEEIPNEEIPNEEIPSVDTPEVEENNQINTPQDRLKHWIKSNFKNDSQFCREIDMNRSSLYNYLPGGDRIIPKKYNEKLIELGLDLKWYLEGDKALDGKKAHVKRTRKDAGEFGSPQARLKQWIKENFKSAAAFAAELGVHPNYVYNHTSPTGQVYGKKYLPILSKMGLDVNWYLKGRKRKHSAEPTQPSEHKREKEMASNAPGTPAPGINEPIAAPEPTLRPDFPAEIAFPGSQSFSKMLEQYATREAELIDAKLRIDNELEKVQAIRLHLIELDKLFKA